MKTLGVLGVLAFVLSPASPPSAEAQANIWTSCRNVCMRSCQWEKGVMTLRGSDARVAKVGNECWQSAECKKVDEFFAPNDPKIDSDARALVARYLTLRSRPCRGTRSRSCPRS